MSIRFLQLALAVAGASCIAISATRICMRFGASQSTFNGTPGEASVFISPNEDSAHAEVSIISNSPKSSERRTLVRSNNLLSGEHVLRSNAIAELRDVWMRIDVCGRPRLAMLLHRIPDIQHVDLAAPANLIASPNGKILAFNVASPTTPIEDAARRDGSMLSSVTQPGHYIVSAELADHRLLSAGFELRPGKQWLMYDGASQTLQITALDTAAVPSEAK
jgi:hypothetical protein